MSKFLTILSVLVAATAIGYVGYDRWEESQREETQREETQTPSPVAVVSDPEGAIGESYSNLDEWDANVYQAYIVAKNDKTDEVVQLCDNSGLTVVEQRTDGKSNYILLICSWKKDVTQEKMDEIRNHPSVEFLNVDTCLNKEANSSSDKSWDLKSWIEPLEFQKKSSDAQHDSKTHEEGSDPSTGFPSNKRPL